MTQRARKNGGGGNAINIEVAEDHNVIAAPNSLLKLVNHVFHARNVIGIGPIPIKRGTEEAFSLLGRGHAARRERGRNESRKPQLLFKQVNNGRIRLANVKLNRHNRNLMCA